MKRLLGIVLATIGVLVQVSFLLFPVLLMGYRGLIEDGRRSTLRDLSDIVDYMASNELVTLTVYIDNGPTHDLRTDEGYELSLYRSVSTDGTTGYVKFKGELGSSREWYVIDGDLPGQKLKTDRIEYEATDGIVDAEGWSYSSLNSTFSADIGGQLKYERGLSRVSWAIRQTPIAVSPPGGLVDGHRVGYKYLHVHR